MLAEKAAQLSIPPSAFPSTIESGFRIEAPGFKFRIPQSAIRKSHRKHQVEQVASGKSHHRFFCNLLFAPCSVSKQGASGKWQIPSPAFLQFAFCPLLRLKARGKWQMANPITGFFAICFLPLAPSQSKGQVANGKAEHPLFAPCSVPPPASCNLQMANPITGFFAICFLPLAPSQSHRKHQVFSNFSFSIWRKSSSAFFFASAASFSCSGARRRRRERTKCRCAGCRPLAIIRGIIGNIFQSH